MWFTNACTQAWGTKLCWSLVHVLCVGILVAYDYTFDPSLLSYKWYSLLYIALLVTTVVQYFCTAGSSPGYVEDLPSEPDLEACLKNRGGADRCPHCRILQPVRAKHCNDCDKCVLRFDHHCVWLGTCIGQYNHVKFWWYILLETALCTWTSCLYLFAYRSAKNWFLNLFLLVVFVGLLCCSIFLATLLIFHSYLVVTNQTTFEKTRRKRISYLRNLPGNVHPFSQSTWSNVCEFCCGGANRLYSLPQHKSLPQHQSLLR